MFRNKLKIYLFHNKLTTSAHLQQHFLVAQKLANLCYINIINNNNNNNNHAKNSSNANLLLRSCRCIIKQVCLPREKNSADMIYGHFATLTVRPLYILPIVLDVLPLGPFTTWTICHQDGLLPIWFTTGMICHHEMDNLTLAVIIVQNLAQKRFNAVVGAGLLSYLDQLLNKNTFCGTRYLSHCCSLYGTVVVVTWPWPRQRFGNFCQGSRRD